MKMSQLKMVIREVVREEIRSGLKEIIGSVKKQPVQKSKPQQKQNYSKNPVLNEVLNDTDSTDWETMGGAEYTSERMGEIMGNSYKDLIGDNQPQNGGISVEGQQPDFLKKDYRAIMDAVDKKQGK
tara:strand:- start:1389 stop:1766 length:378 start_codon:yes stop_codon:yes gene_type:complete